MARERRLTIGQVGRLVEGAELISAATGLSISEVINLVLNEPEIEEVPDEIEARLKVAGGDR